MEEGAEVITKSSPIKTSQPASLPSFVNLGLGGVPGAGKTHLLGTVGKGKRILVYDTEGGTVTFNSQAFKEDPAATEVSNIDVVTFEDITKTRDLVHRISSGLDYITKTKNKDGYELVAIDSITEFQEIFISLDDAKNPMQSYGRLRESLRELVIKARNAPVHTIFTARLKYTEDEVLGREVVQFQVSPGANSVIGGLFDVIGYLTVQKKGLALERQFDATHNTRTQGKDRYGIGKISDPTAKDLIAAIEQAAKDS